MGATRFFVSGIFEIGEAVELAAQDARKLAVVLRAEPGDAIEVVDSSGKSYGATIRFEGLRVYGVLERELSMPAPLRLEVTLAQGLPKGQKMDFIVEKATELGIARVVPFVSSRTAGEGARPGKLDRWRRLARTAAQQSGRSDIPEIDAPLDFPALVALVPAFDLTLVPWELAEQRPLGDRLPALLAGARSVLVAIGPEGGFFRRRNGLPRGCRSAPHFAWQPHFEDRNGGPHRLRSAALCERRHLSAPQMHETPAFPAYTTRS